MDTRTNGKAHTFTGEYKDWPEWPFQLKHFAGQPWKNLRPNCISESTRLRGSQPTATLVCSTTVQKKRAGDSEEHRNQITVLKRRATYDSNHKGRQRAVAGAETTDAVSQTTATVER